MPDSIQRTWNKVRQSVLKAITAIRREIINSFPVKKIASCPLGERLLKDGLFRSGVSLHVSLILNFSYGAVQFLAGICSRSIWLGALAAYHILLAVMQFHLSSYVSKNDGVLDEIAELRQYRFCGISLLLMTPVFASILILIIHKNSRAEYSGFLIYFAAVFALIKIVSAISNVIRFKKSESPVLSAAKALSLIAAMISILPLETAVLSRYGNMRDPIFYLGMLGTAGGAVCVFALSKALAMIIRATQQLKEKQTADDP